MSSIILMSKFRTMSAEGILRELREKGSISVYANDEHAFDVVLPLNTISEKLIDIGSFISRVVEEEFNKKAASLRAEEMFNSKNVSDVLDAASKRVGDVEEPVKQEAIEEPVQRKKAVTAPKKTTVKKTNTRTSVRKSAPAVTPQTRKARTAKPVTKRIYPAGDDTLQRNDDIVSHNGYDVTEERFIKEQDPNMVTENEMAGDVVFEDNTRTDYVFDDEDFIEKSTDIKRTRDISADVREYDEDLDSDMSFEPWDERDVNKKVSLANYDEAIDNDMVFEPWVDTIEGINNEFSVLEESPQGGEDKIPSDEAFSEIDDNFWDDISDEDEDDIESFFKEEK